MPGYRPPQWSKPALVILTVPGVSQTTSSPETQGTASGTSTSLSVGGSAASTTTQRTTPISYVFDAVLKLHHSQRVTKTRHPVQTGGDISTHAFLEPAQVSMEIGMSDAMDSYATTATMNQPPFFIQQFGGGATGGKSVAAYVTLRSLQAARTPVNLTTRLWSYTNMIITAIEPDEDSRTITGLRMRVEFEQIFIANIGNTTTSARPDATDSNAQGLTNTTAPTTGTLQQFTYAGTPVDVPGAGSLSSSPVTSSGGS